MKGDELPETVASAEHGGKKNAAHGQIRGGVENGERAKAGENPQRVPGSGDISATLRSPYRRRGSTGGWLLTGSGVRQTDEEGPSG